MLFESKLVTQFRQILMIPAPLRGTTATSKLIGRISLAMFWMLRMLLASFLLTATTYFSIQDEWRVQEMVETWAAARQRLMGNVSVHRQCILQPTCEWGTCPLFLILFSSTYRVPIARSFFQPVFCDLPSSPRNGKGPFFPLNILKLANFLGRIICHTVHSAK